MPTFRETNRLLNIDADKESWKRSHDEAQSCLDLAQQLVRGVETYHEMLDWEAQTQRDTAPQSGPTTDQSLDLFPSLYQLWIYASEFYLEEALDFAGKGHAVAGLDEFRTTLEEARCLVGSWIFEEQIRPVEALIAGASPQNPNPERYRD